MTFLVNLYPRAWRSRYGEEFRAILAAQPISPGIVLDVLAGALDARLHKQLHLQPTESENGDSMTISMMRRCLAGGPTPSQQDRKSARTGTMLASLAVAILYLALTKVYRSAPAVQAVGAAGFPAIILFYEQMAYLRQRPIATRVVLACGMAILMYLFMWAVCLLATQI